MSEQKDKWYLSGNLGIGTSEPYTRLHIVDEKGVSHEFDGDKGYGNPMLTGKHIELAATEMWGLKQAYGTLYTWNSDSLFIGLKDEGDNRKDAVIAFGDDEDGSLRIMFTRWGERPLPGQPVPPLERLLRDPKELLRISSYGTVGIGNNLFLSGTTEWRSISYNAYRNEKGNWNFPDKNRTAVTLEIGDALDGKSRFDIFTTTTSNKQEFQLRLRVDGETGNVGIGTTTPEARLHVNGNVKVDTGNLSVPSGAILNHIAIGVDPSPVKEIGDVKFPYPYETIGTTHPHHNLRLHSNNAIYLHCGNSQESSVSFDKDGNAGFGTTPDARLRLHVKGDTKIQGNLIIDGALITIRSIGEKDAVEILKNYENGTAIIGSAGGVKEPRVDFYYKYNNQVYMHKLIGGEIKGDATKDQSRPNSNPEPDSEPEGPVEPPHGPGQEPF